MRVALATYEDLPALDPDEQPLIPALDELGADVEVAVWSDPNVDWGSFDGVLIRSVWDYFLRHGEFLAWTHRVERETAVWNPPELLRWNSEKGYLRDLAERGVPVVPTVYLSQGGDPDPAALLAERGWSDAVAKPTVAGGSLGLRRLPAEPLGDLLAAGDAMVQPFLSSVHDGELSVVCLDGRPSHAVRKVPRPGDIRVQPEHGGRILPASPSPRELEAVEAVLDALESPWLYARVDLLPGPDGELLLMELEAIEPRLFLAGAPGAAERVARAFLERLG